MSAELPDPPPVRPMSREGLEHLLLAVRNASALAVGNLVVENRHGGLIQDQRAVWHATEVALAILRPGYVPKKETTEDIRALLAWLDDPTDDAWKQVD